MLKNYLVIAWRNLKRNPGYSLINMAGLMIGFLVSSLIFLYILNELSYDCFHDGYKNIYRVAIRGEISKQPFDFAVSPAPMAPAAMREIPGITRATRLKNTGEVLLSKGPIHYYEDRITFTDSCFFKVFSFPLLSGDPEQALEAPFSMVISRSQALKYFGKTDVLGEVLQWNHQFQFTINGVFEDIPETSHLEFDFLVSYSTLEKAPEVFRMDLNNWGSLSFYTYLKINPEVPVDTIRARIKDLFIKEFTGDNEDLENFDMSFDPYLQRIDKIHLHSSIQAEFKPNSDISYIYWLIATAGFILIIASINFMNLSTARSANRAREAGLRKVFGANRSKLMKQFLGESLMMSFTALFLALVLMEISLPVFNQLTGKSIAFRLPEHIPFILGLIALTGFVGLVSGSYPALYLSAFQPAHILRRQQRSQQSSKLLRNVLVIIQYTVSVLLIISTLIIFKQLHYIRNKDLGFSRQNLLIITLRNQVIQKQALTIVQKISALPEVEEASWATGYPGGRLDGRSYYPEGMSGKEPWLIYEFTAGDNFLSTMHIEIIDGRNFIPASDHVSREVLVNEKLVETLGWKDPIGKILRPDSEDSLNYYTVAGVMKNFNHQSLHGGIEPVLVKYSDEEARYVLVRLQGNDLKEEISKIEKVWKEVAPEFPFDFFFLDQTLEKNYEFESRLAHIFVFLSFLAVFIASMGLFGLTSYTAEQRSGEIGIRKAVGATAWDIISMLSAEYVKIVIIACLFAWPLAYYISSWWLRNFEYQTPISFWIFLLASLGGLLTALITVNIQGSRSAFSNPAKILRYEG